jgi:hypothetical protein
MPNLYESLLALLREHWKTHNNAYPQRFELTASDLQALLQERSLVNETMNFKQVPGWEGHFHGTPVQAADVSCMVDVHGQHVPLSMAVLDASKKTE